MLEALGHTVPNRLRILTKADNTVKRLQPNPRPARERDNRTHETHERLVRPEA